MRAILLLAALWTAARAATPSADELLRATDDLLRGDSSVATLTMHVRTRRYERSMKLRMWTRGTERTLIVVEEPAKDRGTATLKVGDAIWNYLPRVDRTIKLPAAMMSGAWMGSHFTNDDLVKEDRFSEEFDARVVATPEDGGAWRVEAVPHPDAPVVWGKVVVELDADRIPRRIEYYDEDGALVRTMTFDDVREVDGRRVPMRIRVEPADKPGEFTEVVYEDLDFDVDIPDTRFSLQALGR